MLNASEATIEAPPTRINYRIWLVRVISWDGVLPVLLWLSPLLVRLLVPGINKDAGVLLAVPLSICVFFIRIWFGARHIDANHCERFRVVQYYCFLFAILVLLFVDALLLALHGEFDENLAAYFGLLRDLSIPFAIYLALMAVAMYPGREPVPSTQLGNWEIEC